MTLQPFKFKGFGSIAPDAKSKTSLRRLTLMSQTLRTLSIEALLLLCSVAFGRGLAHPCNCRPVFQFCTGEDVKSTAALAFIARVQDAQ